MRPARIAIARPGLHVERAGAMEPAVPDLHRHLRERPDRPHGIEVAEQQDLSRAVADRGAQVRAGRLRQPFDQRRRPHSGVRQSRRRSGPGRRRRRSATRFARGRRWCPRASQPARGGLPQVAGTIKHHEVGAARARAVLLVVICDPAAPGPAS